MKYLNFLIFLMLAGCSTVKAPETFVYKEISAPPFELASWQKIKSPIQSVKIYIEGDGYAFNAYGQPTNNPTPRGKFMRELAWGDNHANVVYLARPCQFVQSRQCAQKYWTTARFSAEVVASEAEAIKEIAQGRPVILVGYSGGAMVAGLVAVKYPDLDIKEVITIAGNMNHRTWTDYHKVPSLDESLNLADYKEEFSRIKQIHYVGSDDKIVPPFLTKNMINNNSKIRLVPQAEHGKGFEAVYSEIRSK